VVRPRQVGPDLPSGVRRPSRAVSLGDVRDLPVQTMGFDFDEFDRLISEGTSEAERNPWDLVEDPATGELVERRGSPQEYQTLQTYERILRGYTDSELAEEIADLEEWIDHAPADADDWGSEGREGAKARLKQALEEKARRAQQAGGQPAGAAGAEMQGLTADEAFRQHHVTSGAGAMGGMNAARAIEGQQEMPWGPRQEALDVHIPEARRILEEAKRRAEEAEAQPRPSGRPVVEGPPIPPPLSQMAGPDWDAIEEGDYGAGNWWDTVPGMDDLGDALPDPDEPLNPELRSMDSQMLADMMVAQPEQGYFGGLGDAVQGLTNRVAGMSGQERAALIAALVAAGLITVGSGGTLAPAGAALLGGAGLTALNQ
jgi:hypothetical protein